MESCGLIRLWSWESLQVTTSLILPRKSQTGYQWVIEKFAGADLTGIHSFVN
jgi:hypothetical protein